MKIAAAELSFSVYATPFGYGAVVAENDRLTAHHLPYREASYQTAADWVAAHYPRAFKESPLTRDAARLLSRYFEGDRVEFDLPLDLEGLSPFRGKVFREVSRIPYGTVLSYAQVAAACGSPGAARAVGGAMAANFLPILIPCHRVIGASGALTGFTAPGGVASKRQLLMMEGRNFAENGGIARGDLIEL